MAYLEIKNFYKSFGQTKVLKGIDLSLEKGEVVSIIGSSGSGKTTLLRCINFLETPNEGTMTLDGEILFDGNVKKQEKESVLREKRLNFGLVFQSFNLFPQYTVLKNITLAPTLLLKKKVKDYKKELKEKAKLDASLTKKDIAEKVSLFKKEKLEEIKVEGIELIKKIGLEEKINNYPCELSGGQCQRVAIARALALKPKILCFDEPTSALDPELTGEVLRVIKELKDKGCTMIVVTHEMEFARKVADRAVFFADGVIEEQGKPEELFLNPKSPKTAAFLGHVSGIKDI